MRPAARRRGCASWRGDSAARDAGAPFARYGWRRYDRAAMARRNLGRLLAPLALAAAVVATVLIVDHGLSNGRSATSASAAKSRDPTRSRVSRTRGAATTHRPGASASYVVKSGDSLSAISARTGVPLPTLESLNPSVNPSNLQTGQRLRLRR